MTKELTFLTYINRIAVMFTYKFFINKSGKLFLRLRNNNVKCELSMDIDATENELIVAATTPKGLKSRLGRVVSANSAILNMIGDKLAMEGRRDEDVKKIRDTFLEYIGRKKREESANTFLNWFKRFAEGKRNKGTRGVYEHTISKMLDFDKYLARRRFEDINIGWLTDFEAFCAKTASKNARNIHLRNIRAVFNNAIDNEVTAAYPFRRFKIRPEATRKRSLTVEELRRFIAMEVEDYQQFYKDMFILSFFLIGINTVDLARLTEVTNDGRVEYDRAKTHRKYSIKLEPEAMEIINRYRGDKALLCIADRWSDHRNFLHQFNKALKNMGEVERVGRGGKKVRTPAFPELSSYWCRHTWATIAYNECGISEDIIGQALGHASVHTTTSIYIRRNAKLVDDANRRVLDLVLYGKR